MKNTILNIYFILITLTIVSNFTNQSFFNLFVFLSSVFSFYYTNRFITLDKIYRDLKWLSEHDSLPALFFERGEINERFWNDIFMPIFTECIRNLNKKDRILENLISLRVDYLSENKGFDRKSEKSFKSSLKNKYKWIYNNL